MTPAVTACLVGDLGGTHTRLAIAELSQGSITLTAKAIYLNRDAVSLEALIQDFLDTHQVQTIPSHACLAIAGPVEGPRARLTNLDWQLDSGLLQQTFGFRYATLINDFVAVAQGIDQVPPEAKVFLQARSALPHTPRLVLGPGTGLGVAQCLWTENRYRPLASEGGHIAFAPMDDEQASLLAYLRAKQERVSVERILSGPGIADLYAFQLAAAGCPDQADRSPAEISRAALAGTDPQASQALRLFARILGQTAGDLALVSLARGGVFIAGGIPAKILPVLEREDFLVGFTRKGRFSDWVEQVPVCILTDPDLGLRGAAVACFEAQQG